jgi:hypothetical protein
VWRRAGFYCSFQVEGLRGVVCSRATGLDFANGVWIVTAGKEFSLTGDGCLSDDVINWYWYIINLIVLFAVTR